MICGLGAEFGLRMWTRSLCPVALSEYCEMLSL